MDPSSNVNNQQAFHTVLGLRPPSPSRAADGQKQGKMGRLSPHYSSSFSTSAATATTAASSMAHSHQSSSSSNHHHQQQQSPFLLQNQHQFEPLPLQQQQYQQQQKQEYQHYQQHHYQQPHQQPHQQQQHFQQQQQHQPGFQTNAFVQHAPSPAAMMRSGYCTDGNDSKSEGYIQTSDGRNVLQPLQSGDLQNSGKGSEYCRPRVVVDNPPSENPRAEDVDKITAVSLNELSMESREQVLFDLHGIAKDSSAAETPEFMHLKLQAMETSLQHSKDKAAYDMAVSIDPQYVADPAFRAKFLRAEDYDVPRAAIRFIKHFQSKLELFDASLLCKDITQDELEHLHRATSSSGDNMDITDNNSGLAPALQSLYSGWIQEFPVRDVAGRLCSVIFQQMLDPNLSVENLLRAVFYRRMVNSEDMETQRKGIVLIMYKSAHAFDRVLIWKIGRLLSCLPVRFMAYHMCFDHDEYEKISPIIALGRMAVDAYDRHRFRVHKGPPMELNYALQTFGIPVANMPIDANTGVVSTEYNGQFWMSRREEERLRSAAAGGGHSVSSIQIVSSTPNVEQVTVRVATPGNNDVLLGRGKSFQDHAGNVRFRYLIEQYHHDYETAIKNVKTNVALKVLSLIHERGGRFLTASEVGWVEVDEVSAREKIASCFRSYRKIKYPARYKKHFKAPGF